MRAGRLLIVGLASLFFVLAATGESLAGVKLYQGSWIAESFGNDRVNIGTEESQYFEVLGIPQGINCHPIAPLCHITSTPVTTTGNTTAPGANGTAWIRGLRVSKCITSGGDRKCGLGRDRGGRPW